MRLAVNFPDETAFYFGMGIDLYENSLEIQRIFKRLKIFAGFDLKKIIYGQCKELSENQKRIAVVVTSVVIYREWKKTSGIRADYMCGKGSGYISAMVCAEKLPLWYAVWCMRWGKMKIPFFVDVCENIYNTEEGDMSIIQDCEVLLEIGPSNMSESIMIEKKKFGSQRKVYFDNPYDSSYLFEHIKKQKLFNYLYAARRLSGIAVATPNHTTDSEDYIQLDAAYTELINRIDVASKNLYQNNIKLTEDGFNECAKVLKTILHIKKVDYEEVAGQLIELQSETGIDMYEYFQEWIC